MSFLEEESASDNKKSAVRVNIQKKTKETDDPRKIISCCSTSVKSSPTPQNISKVSFLNCEKILTSLSEDIASGRYIFPTRLNNASSTNRKEGYQLLGQAIFPTAQIANFSKDNLAKLA